MSKTEATQIVTSQNFFVHLAAKEAGRQIAFLCSSHAGDKNPAIYRLIHNMIEKHTDEFLGHLRNCYPCNDDFHASVMETLFDHVNLTLREIEDGTYVSR